MSIEDLWERIEAVVAAVHPAGLRPPASRDDLDALGVPEAWRAWWGRHDGQADEISGLYRGWFLMPLRGVVDSVEAELEAVPDGWFPIAKDFSGGFVLLHRETGRVEVWEDEDGERLGVGPEVWLEELADALEEEPPRRWRKTEDGRWGPEDEVDVAVTDLGSWAVGEARDLGDGLVVVRIASPDPGPFPPPVRIDLALDHPLPDGRGALQDVKLAGAAGSVSSQGFERWIGSKRPWAPEARLVLTIDRGLPIEGFRPLTASRSGQDAVERGRALAALGDTGGALEALGDGSDDPELFARLLLAAGDPRAPAAVARLRPGHDLRIRLALATDPQAALAEAEARVGGGSDPRALLWRAAAREACGDLQGASADTLQALRALPEYDEHAVAVEALLARRRSGAPRATASGPDLVIAARALEAQVELTREREGWTATVALTPAEAAVGRLVSLPFPGAGGVIRLPAGAGHGVRARFADVAPDGAPVEVQVRIVLPDGWAPGEAVNPTLTFDRWDVVAEVPRAGRVRVAGLGSTHEVEVRRGGEVRIAGGGLARARGEPGDLVVRAT